MSEVVDKTLKGRAISGGRWSVLRRVSTQLIAFAVTLLLARLLTPEDFGLVAMLTVFVEVGVALSEAGITRALVRTVNISDADYSTALVYNISVSLAIYVIIFFCSPLIARFYNAPSLELLAKLIALNIPLRSLSSLKLCTLEAELNFKLPAIAEFTSTLIAGTVGMVMALCGCGVMSLAGYQIGNALLLTLILVAVTGRRKFVGFSKESFRRLFGFGNKLLAGGLLHVIYNNMYLFTIGKVYNAADLGYFTRARQFASVPPVGVGESVKGVAYSALCRFKDNSEGMNIRGLRIMKLCAFVIFPIMAFVAMFSHPLIEVLIGEKWIAAANMLIIMCVGMVFYPIDVLNLQIIQVSGHSNLYLQSEIWKKIVGVTALLSALPFGIFPLAAAFSLSGFIGTLINMKYCSKSGGPSPAVQWRQLIPLMLMALFSAVAASLLTYFIGNMILKLAAGLIVCAGIYLLFAIILKRSELADLGEIVSFKRLATINRLK